MCSNLVTRSCLAERQRSCSSASGPRFESPCSRDFSVKLLSAASGGTNVLNENNEQSLTGPQKLWGTRENVVLFRIIYFLQFLYFPLIRKKENQLKLFGKKCNKKMETATHQPPCHFYDLPLTHARTSTRIFQTHTHTFILISLESFGCISSVVEHTLMPSFQSSTPNFFPTHTCTRTHTHTHPHTHAHTCRHTHTCTHAHTHTKTQALTPPSDSNFHLRI